MKNFLKLALIIGLANLTQTSRAQLFDFNFFNGGINDGIKLFVPYITPYVNAFGTDLNGGWFNSASPHKLGGFDITFTTSVSKIPAVNQSFDLADHAFEHITVVGSNTIAPTIAGSSNDGPDLEYRVNGIAIASFSAPGGTGFSFLPSPMLQAGVGLPFGTEIVGRFMPNVTIPSTKAKFGLWGIGLKHSILQHFKVLEHLPMDVSLFFGYTKLSSTAGISIQPLNYDNLTYTPEDFKNQEVTTATKGINLSLIASTKLPVINVYGALGYSKSSTEAIVVGLIPIPAYDPLLDPLNPVVRDVDVQTIPKIEIKNLSGLRTTIGARLKLAVVTIHADYTYAKYSVYTVGVGFSFR